MKRIITPFAIFFLVFAATEGFGQGGWLERQSGTTARLRSISSSDGFTAVSVGDTGVVVTTENAGVTWRVQKSLFWQNTASINLNGVIGIAAKVFCAVGAKDSVFRSEDGGVNWSRIRSHAKGTCNRTEDGRREFTQLTAIDFDRSNKTCISVGDGGVAIFSSDSGKHWVENLLSATDQIHCVSSNGITLVGAWLGLIYASNDKGDNWSHWDMISDHFYFRGIDVRGWTAVGDEGAIYHSLDKGLNWFPIASGTIANLNAVHFADKANGYIVGDGGLVLYTNDGGSSWKKQSVPTKENLRSVHFVDPFIGFICGDNGTILTTTNGGYSVDAVGATPQSGFSIRVYPNPTSLRTTVSVNIPHSSQIHLRIFDMLGKEVASLANGAFEAGIQNFPWNISSVANGVYICKLEADGMILQSQIVVQK